MKKNKTTEQKFIAITDDNIVIGIGNYKIVKAAIEEYANDTGMDEDRVDDFIEIYELGSKKNTNANSKGLDIEFY